MEDKHQYAAPNTALDWRFLRRTFFSTLATTLLVGLFSSVYYSEAFGGRYLLFGLWALFFFSLTGLMFKYLLFLRDLKLGLLFAGLKVACFISLIIVMVWIWPIPSVDHRADRPQMLAMILGVTTPFAVLILRVIGFILEAQRKGLSLGSLQAPPSKGSSKSSQGQLGSHP